MFIKANNRRNEEKKNLIFDLKSVTEKKIKITITMLDKSERKIGEETNTQISFLFLF